MTVDPLEPKDVALARFDPMLRALVAFGLVERDSAEEDGRGQWRLSPPVQRRLASLVSPAPPADKLIYFGHRCASCREHAPTRLRAGVLLCDECRDAAAQADEPRSQPA